jgi:putative hydrolase of the HAD superfamily
MIKNIVFDLGNVIIQWDPKHIIAQYTKNPVAQKELLDKIFGSSYWLAFDDGSMTREEVIYNIQKTTSFKYRSLIVDIIYYWYQHCPMVTGMEEVIQTLKKQGYGIYLLSNTNIHFDEYKDTLPVMKHFDGFYISAKTKLTKPHPEIFLDFLQTFQLVANECIFIDDIHNNVLGAKHVGMKGYHFTGDVTALQQHLNDIL